MKKIIYILTIILIALACKDPNVGPGDGKDPVGNAGLIRFDNPAIGQTSYYIKTTAKGYYEPTPQPIVYSNDSIRWEITKQIDRNKYQITETIIGNIFTDGTGTNTSNTLILEKSSTGVLIYTKNTMQSPLLGYQDSIKFDLQITNLFHSNFWRIESNPNSLISFGFVEDYEINGKTFERLDVYSNLEPMTYDGSGNVYAYNQEFGVTRQYSINPWIGEMNGFDLVTDLKKGNVENSDLIKRWRLAYVHYKDGTKKSITDILHNGANNNERPNFILNFLDESSIEGQSGCNQYSADYKTDNGNIVFSNFTTTEVYCFFTDVYTSILQSSSSYKLEENRLILSTEHEEYVALEFVEEMDTRFGLNLQYTNWNLWNVHFQDNSIIPINKLVGSNTSSSNFTLYFKELGRLDGFSGCNKFGGRYSIEKEMIDIEAGNITEVFCDFSDEYGKILSHSTVFKLDEDHLIIFSKYSKYRALEFDRIR